MHPALFQRANGKGLLSLHLVFSSLQQKDRGAQQRGINAGFAKSHKGRNVSQRVGRGDTENERVVSVCAGTRPSVQVRSEGEGARREVSLD